MTEVAAAIDPAPAAAAPDSAPAAEPVVPAGAPEAYTDFTLPEGMGMDQQRLDAFLPIFKEQGFSQEQAQAMVGQHASAMLQASSDADTLVAGWETASKADPEIGGEQYDANMGIAKGALTKFGSPELEQLLTDSGLAQSPEMRRFLFRVGKTMQPDSPGGNTAPAQAAPADRVSVMYPNAKVG